MRADFGGGRNLMRQLIDKLEPTGTYAIGVQPRGRPFFRREQAG